MRSLLAVLLFVAQKVVHFRYVSLFLKYSGNAVSKRTLSERA